MKTKRILALALAVVMSLGMLTACGKEEKPSNTPTGTGTSTQWSIEPLEEKQTLRLAYFSGVMHSLPIYIADEKGWFDEVGIELDYNSFTSGPAMMEANDSWDIATSGSPGVLVGMIGYDVKCIGNCEYDAVLNLYVREDSPIYQAGENKDHPGLYGTAEEWKGTEWLLPVGTTTNIVLDSTLDLLGLKESDITLVNMDNSTAFAGFKAGEGDGVCLSLSVAMMAEKAGFKQVSGLNVTNDLIECGMCATEDALTNKREAIKKFYEVYYRTSQWIADNMEEATDYYLETCDIEGIVCDEDTAAYICERRISPTLGEVYSQFTTETDYDNYSTRAVTKAESDLLVTMDFFVSIGKYTDADRAAILDNKMMDDSIAMEVHDDMVAGGRWDF